MQRLNLAFPFRLNSRGRSDTAGDERHVRGMLEMLLLTNAGERVNRPGYGGGLARLLFGPVSPELAVTLQQTLRAEVIQWLDDVVNLQDLDVAFDESRIVVTISYVLRSDGDLKTSQFSYDT